MQNANLVEKPINKVFSTAAKVAVMILPVVAGILVVRQIDKIYRKKGKAGWMV